MTRNNRLLHSFLLLGGLILLPGCQDTINNLSTELYSSGQFSVKDLSRGQIAITPVVPGDDTKAEAKALSEFLDQEFSKKLPSSTLLTSAQLRQHLAGDPVLAGEWALMSPHISVHSIKGMEATQSFAKRLGVRYLLESQIQYAEVGGGAEQVRFFSRIYDRRLHRIVWEGIGEGRGYERLFFPTTPAPFLTVAQTAARGLVSRLFGH
jgi:hypothetical protein